MHLRFKILSAMIMAAGFVVCLGLFLVDRDDPTTIVLPESAVPVKDYFKAKFDLSNELRFRTFNGEWMGTDCDVDILLRADGSAHLTVYGNAILKSEGSFAFMNANRMSFEFPEAYISIPDMEAYRVESDYLLVPAHDTQGFIRGDRYRDGHDQWKGLNWTFSSIVKIDRL